MGLTGIDRLTGLKYVRKNLGRKLMFRNFMATSQLH